MRTDRRHQAGFTLTEVICGMAIVSGLSLCATRILNAYFSMQRIAAHSNYEQVAEHSLVPLTLDLKEADANTFQWLSLPANTLTFSKIEIDKSTGLPGAPVDVTYEFVLDPGSTTVGTLQRRKNGRVQVLLRNVLAPTTIPLFQDAGGGSRIVIISLKYRPDSMAPFQITRRITIRG